MNRKTKIAIFLVATMITLTGFNLMISPSTVDIMKLGKAAAFNVDVTVTAKLGSSAQPVVHINGLP